MKALLLLLALLAFGCEVSVKETSSDDEKCRDQVRRLPPMGGAAFECNPDQVIQQIYTNTFICRCKDNPNLPAAAAPTVIPEKTPEPTGEDALE